MQENDLDKNGALDDFERKLTESRQKSQRLLAIFAMIGLVASGIYILTLADVSRIEALGTALDFFWVSMSGIVATHMGSEAWIASKKG